MSTEASPAVLAAGVTAPAVLRLRGSDEIVARVGTSLGVGPWRTIDAPAIGRFADATGDHQPIHLDAAAARASGLPGPIAHGYLTLALEPLLVADVVTFEGFTHALNYGLERVRFPAPLVAGSAVRARVTLAAAERAAHHLQITLDVAIEVRDGERPVCVARPVRRLVERGASAVPTRRTTSPPRPFTPERSHDDLR